MRSSGPRANGRKPCGKNQLVQEIKTKDLKINKTGRLSGMTLKFLWLIVWKWSGGWGEEKEGRMDNYMPSS